MVDDVATLEWIGYEALEIFRFVRAVRALCRKVRVFFLHKNTAPLYVVAFRPKVRSLCGIISRPRQTFRTLSSPNSWMSAHITWTYGHCIVGEAELSLER